jgi:hypothetical protein
MKKLFLIFALIITGCSSTPSTTTSFSNTMEIIAAAAEASPDKVSGVFQLKIQAAGSDRKRIFLNTELDYRDPRNITLVLNPSVIPSLENKYGSDLESVIIGKTLKVSGQAQMVRINFTSQGRRTNKYYYQTHIHIDNLAQLKIAETRYNETVQWRSSSI